MISQDELNLLVDKNRKNKKLVELLNNEIIKTALFDSDLTLEEFVRPLENYAFVFKRLSNQQIQNRLKDRSLTVRQVLDMSIAASSLFSGNYQVTQYLTIEQMLNINDIAFLCLTESNIEELFLGDNLHITIEQILDIDMIEIQEALLDDNVRACLMNGDFNFEDLVDCILENGGDYEVLINEVQQRREVDPEPELNHNQSTHTASVHKSASESALRLQEHYQDKLSNTSIAAICSQLLTLEESETRQAAFRCLNYFEKNKFYASAIDPLSGIGLRELLKLSFLSIYDDSRRVATKESVLEAFADGLYEIMRGGNLNNDKGVDDKKEDDPICFGGAFNKIIEKQVSLHEDYEQVYLNRASASLYLPTLVKNELKKYLLNQLDMLKQNNQSTVALGSEVAFMLSESIINDRIWSEIRQVVSSQFFDRYGCLFDGNQNDDFNLFIDSGRLLSSSTIKNLTQLVNEKFTHSSAIEQSLTPSTLFSNQDSKATVQARLSLSSSF
ncbi:MAG: hypothetical protein EP298_11215 [Gammaproteobacteria bacterium]|nr:MAG: hypothetical protein EP298_11215 [Gammaproteobacteria bacterium]UTW43187.1 hypothetical protein KFE69_03315 [bacterium SCSIO 12844]